MLVCPYRNRINGKGMCHHVAIFFDTYKRHFIYRQKFDKLEAPLVSITASTGVIR